jgi:hypothetical protein
MRAQFAGFITLFSQLQRFCSRRILRSLAPTGKNPLVNIAIQKFAYGPIA